MIKVVVCIKIVKGEINLFDACALECALRLDHVETTVLCMGPKSVLPVLESLTRLGSFRTILLCDDLYAGSDTLATGYILSRALEKLRPELILCGRQSTDGDTGQIGPALAARLGFSLVANVMKFPQDLLATRQCTTRQGIESVELPAVLTIERINTLRFASLKSQTRNVEVWDNSVLQADPTRCGLNGSPTRVLNIAKLEYSHRHCQFIDRNELPELIEHLKSTPDAQKQTRGISQSDKFDDVWVIGEEIKSTAAELGKRVTCIDPALVASDPARFVHSAIHEGRPQVILLPANSAGRRLAAQLAVGFETGLCADCTSLEKRGDRLIMRRPAGQGELLAEIECRTTPQMATVRYIDHDSTSELVVGCGRGVKHDFARAKDFAERLGASLAASRGLVDDRIAPYELQAGLTGRTISPTIYIAIGISGAVHHLCGVETSRFIIAINPDRNARIFDYADYGILEKF
ncbi:MAG: FAD-binding protein [Thermoguttaceae bacterium]|nr:FAD-binding protein [Thermoguttaceae bacterium]